MTTDRKEHPVGAPDLRLAIADWRGRSPSPDDTHLANNETSGDEISPLSMAVVSRRSDLSNVCASKTASTPDWSQNKPSRANATQPDAYLSNAPFNAPATAGIIAEVRRAIREELSEAFRIRQDEAADAAGASNNASAKVKLNQTAPEVTAEWGALFTAEGHATPRFGQIMRVLSGHILSKFNPDNDGLVMTPDGLRRFYVSYRLSDEAYPFIGTHSPCILLLGLGFPVANPALLLDIFTSKAPDVFGRIADFLLDMECQHQLIQQSGHERPLVPALTVVGFAQYYMSCILAHPDAEFHRLKRIVADVPSIIVTVSLNEAKESPSPPEILPKAIQRNQLPSKADAKSKQLLDGAFKDLMYELGLQPASPKNKYTPHPPQANDTTTATTQVQVPTPAPEPKPTASENPDYFSSVVGSSRSTSRQKYAQPSPLHTIGDDDDEDVAKAYIKADGSLKRDESEWHRRERELERASMPGPRPGYSKQHSWHAESAGTDGPAAHRHHQPPSQQQRYGGRTGSQSYSNAPTAPAADSAAVVPQPSSTTTTAGDPRGSVSSNASSSGYWGHGHGGRTPPPTRHNSASVPDVSSTGPFSLSSSSSSSAMGMATPTSASVGPGSPVATSMTTLQWNPLQYRPAAATVPAATVAESGRTSGGVERLEQQKPLHVRWEGVPQQQHPPPQKGTASPTTMTPRTGSIGGQSGKTERRPSQRYHHHGHHYHRRYPSGGGSSAAGDAGDDKDNRKGETWEEFLRAQKKGDGYHQR
ncbi:hypothetical protein PG997_001227 [Apiospora hydei]|uniref:DUF7514 domain-containing protein n=1 Tax=Apiospora hydei TaxID=1337664 RepID=A0ABR1XCX7_9PEZI